jgi:hypothetical protein
MKFNALNGFLTTIHFQYYIIINNDTLVGHLYFLQMKILKLGIIIQQVLNRKESFLHAGSVLLMKV